MRQVSLDRGIGRDLPDPCGVVRGAGHESFAVGTECYRLDHTVVVQRRAKRLARVRVPQAGGAVIASCQENPAVGAAEGYGSDQGFMRKGEQYSICGQVPEPGFAVEVAGEEFFAVRAKGNAKGTAWLLQWLADFLIIEVPEPGDSRSSIGHPGLDGEGLAIRAEGQSQNQAPLLQSWTERLTRSDRPKLCPFSLGFSLGADDRDQQPPIGAKGCFADPASKLSLPSLFAGGYVPQMSGAIGTSGQAGFPIGTKGHTKLIATRTREWLSDVLADAVTGSRVPELDGAVRISDKEGFPVWREGRGPKPLCRGAGSPLTG